MVSGFQIIRLKPPNLLNCSVVCLRLKRLHCTRGIRKKSYAGQGIKFEYQIVNITGDILFIV
jgi:hypothetical protein